VLLLVAVQPSPTALLAYYDNDPVATTVQAAFFAANGISVVLALVFDGRTIG
jgi:hypothetical protein